MICILNKNYLCTGVSIYHKTLYFSYGPKGGADKLVPVYMDLFVIPASEYHQTTGLIELNLRFVDIITTL